MATTDNILSGDDLATMLRDYGLPTTEWQTAGKSDAVAPLIGGTWNQHYPYPKGIKKLFLGRTKAGLIGSSTRIADNTNSDSIYGTSALRYSGNVSELIRSNVGGASGVMPAVDVTKGSVRVWFRAGPNFFNGSGTVNIRLHSSGSPASPSSDYTEFNHYFSRGQIVPRGADEWGPWQCFAVPGFNATIANDGLKGITQAGAGCVPTAVTYATVNLQVGGTLQCEVGDVEFVPNPRTKGAVIFTFDDSRLDAFTGAAEIMSRYGFPGVVFPGAPSVEVGAPNRLSVTQLRTLQDVHGWQIGSGMWSTEDYTTFQALGKEGQTAFFAKLRMFHAALGLRGGMDGSYQTSISQDKTDIYDVIRQNFRTMRTYGGPNPTGQPVMQFGECAPLSEPMRYKAIDFSASRFNVTNGYANQIKEFVDQAANNKAAAVFVVHNAFESTMTQNLQNLRDMCADVYSRSDIEWITMDDYIRSYS
ncbi:hypothetical protein [Neorhizobium sp. NCHU2750]|uniref:hypothetical protein n=1 Tax=Neorhizobium sp. NCHU2750 TaxID=1825976 RepID=UPI000E70FBE5|nr:hypothetical protein NCHU2750_23680 [Neorhizobium sp. NCHU2750]